MTKKKWTLGTNDVQQEIVEVYGSFGVPNFLQVFPDEEDEETTQNHSEQWWQKSGVSKENRDTVAIKNLMNVTFPHQRDLLIADMEIV